MAQGRPIVVVPGTAMRRRDWLPWCRRAWTQQIANKTTLASHGVAAPTATGTASVFNDTTGQYIDYANAASSNGGLTWNINIQPQTKPIFAAIMKTNTITSVRYWVGLSVGDPRASDDPSTHLAAFRFSTGASDSNWRCCTKDGTTLNNQDSGVAVAADTRYELVVDCSEYNAGTIWFMINGTVVKSSVANLPGSTQSLDPYVSSRDLAAATGRSIRFSVMQILL